MLCVPCTDIAAVGEEMLEAGLNKEADAGCKVVWQASVIMLPPTCVESYFYGHYRSGIALALHAIGYPYIVSPQSMIQPDSLAFDTGYHLNSKGVEKNTERIIEM